MSTFWDIVFLLISAVLIGFALFYAYQDNYAHATYDLIIGLVGIYGLGRGRSK